MSDIEEFGARLNDPRLVHYAYRMSSKENFRAGIFEDFENDYFPNDVEDDRLYGIAAVECNGQHWLVASVPIQCASKMEELAKKNGFIVIDSTHAPWELQITSLFVFEKNPGYIEVDANQHTLQ